MVVKTNWLALNEERVKRCAEVGSQLDITSAC